MKEIWMPEEALCLNTSQKITPVHLMCATMYQQGCGLQERGVIYLSIIVLPFRTVFLRQAEIVNWLWKSSTKTEMDMIKKMFSIQAKAQDGRFNLQLGKKNRTHKMARVLYAKGISVQE